MRVKRLEGIVIPKAGPLRRLPTNSSTIDYSYLGERKSHFAGASCVIIFFFDAGRLASIAGGR